MGSSGYTLGVMALVLAGCATAQTPVAGQGARTSVAPAPPVQVSQDTCPSDTVWLHGDFGSARFSVDVADDGPKRSQGLMFVEHMPMSKGMLFVYPRPQRVAFWMKNTLIPLDMIFADERGVVTKVHSNAIPGDLTSIPGEGLVQYVLEINGGLARQLQIAPGAQLQHPAIQDPAWPCD